MPWTLLQRHPAARILVILVVFALVLGVVGWMAYAALVATPDHVHVVVTDVQANAQTNAWSQRVVFDRTFATIAPQVYADLIAGQRIPPDATFSCPYFEPTYYHYALTFTHLGATTATAEEDATGCAFFGVTYLFGASATYSWFDPMDGSSFWAKLNQLTGAPTPINAGVTG